MCIRDRYMGIMSSINGTVALPGKDSLNSLSRVSYLTTCNKVTLDAYDRVLKRVQSIQDSDKKVQDHLSQQIKEEEEKERKVKEKQKAESLEAQRKLEIQIRENKQKKFAEKIKEAEEFKNTMQNLPEEVVNAYPRITQTPKEIRKARKIEEQERLKKLLEQQIDLKMKKELEKRTKEIQEDTVRLVKTKEKGEKEEEEQKAKLQEKMNEYQKGLRNDIQYHQIRKENEKKLENIESNGINALMQITSCLNDPETKDKLDAAIDDGQRIQKEEKQEEKAEEEDRCEKVSVEPSQSVTETIKTEAGMDKLAIILARKQKKAERLLKKIEELEKNKKSGSLSPQKYSLSKMKEALTPSSYKVNSGGKEIRLSNAAVQELILKSKHGSTKGSAAKGSKAAENEAESQRKTSTKEISTIKDIKEKNQRIALKRYLEQLDKQAEDENKRITETIKREQEAMEKNKQTAHKQKKEKLLYRNLILEQIVKKKDTEIKQNKEQLAIPAIAGTQGYPPIYQPSFDQQKTKLLGEYKTQRSIWIKQMQEKQEKIKKEKVMDTERIATIVTKAKEEDEASKAEYIRRKKDEQQKWKEVWETEMQFRKLQLRVEETVKPSKLKEFKLPLLPSSTHRESRSISLNNKNLSSRGSAISPITRYNSPPNMFITMQPPETVAAPHPPMDNLEKGKKSPRQIKPTAENQTVPKQY
eukprot:TRINITY_DN5455_c0_g1_i1.p1 TRINITY_DN5455_c0_g1~~TRINITY_DN5455_c0_g1_i1.p1  ORF type:complete len:714 (-),score=208.06 TRINITY_DN5455_c0_g1_i1:32-2125(-)